MLATEWRFWWTSLFSDTCKSGYNSQKREQKKRLPYTFWHQFDEKPSVIPDCPGARIVKFVAGCRMLTQERFGHCMPRNALCMMAGAFHIVVAVG